MAAADSSPEYSAEFAAAVERVLADEGGYVFNPSDPGGETNFGISRREYPDLDIKDLTRDDAIAIYYRDFWLKPRLDLLPAPVAAKILDLSVDVGSYNAVRFLQRALNNVGRQVALDGAVGQETAEAAAAMPAEWLLTEIRVIAAHYYRTLAWGRQVDEQFLTGWLRRAYE